MGAGGNYANRCDYADRKNQQDQSKEKSRGSSNQLKKDKDTFPKAWLKKPGFFHDIVILCCKDSGLHDDIDISV